MTAAVKIDEKGRILVPKEIREKLDAKPGDVFYSRVSQGKLQYA